MAGNNNNAKIYIEAVLENLSSLAKDFRSGVENIDTTIPINIDDKDAEKRISQSLQNIFNTLGNTKGFARQLDLSGLLPQVFSTLQSKASDEMKESAVQGFEEGITAFETIANRAVEVLGVNEGKIKSAIENINNTLGTSGIKTYLTELQSVFSFVNRIKVPDDYKEGILNSFVDSLNIGVDANGLGDAIGLSRIADEFKDVNKFALSAQEARNILLRELEAWDQLKPGSKARPGTRRVEGIKGLMSRIEALSGKDFLDYLQTKIADEQTSDGTRAQLEKILSLYQKEKGWGEYFQKWADSDSEEVKGYYNRLQNTNSRVKEMTRRQLEERQKVFEQYGQFKPSQITKGTEPSSTIKYNEETQATEELTKQEQIRRELADKIAKEVDELREKINLLKEIAKLETEVVMSGVESSSEYQEMEALQDVIDEVTRKVNEKTTAFQTEQGVVAGVVKSEIDDLKKLQDKLDKIAGFDNEEKKVDRISKPRQEAEELTEEQKKELEEIKKAEEQAAREIARKTREQSVLGDMDKEEPSSKPETKPKATYGIKHKVKPDAPEKSVNEREAQALRDIKEYAEDAKIGLEQFGKVNEEIVSSVTKVADELKKEATALNSMARTFQKFDDSKIVQQARREKLQEDLSIIQDKITPSKKEVDDFKSSYSIEVFGENERKKATDQLRAFYKDVQTFREKPLNEVTDPLEEAKKEVKLWEAYKEAQRQGVAESNLKRYNPETLGITLHTNAENRKKLYDELENRKKIYTDYANEIQRIQNEINLIDNPPEQQDKKKSKPSSAETKEYQDAIIVIKEYIELQKQLMEAQQNIKPEVTEDSSTGLEQEDTLFNSIFNSAEKAAEAKKKFVEANKEVLQSIVASIPKIEEEAKALEEVGEVQQNVGNSKPFKDEKEQQEKADELQRTLQQQEKQENRKQQEREKIRQRISEARAKRDNYLEEQNKQQQEQNKERSLQKATDIKSRVEQRRESAKEQAIREAKEEQEKLLEQDRQYQLKRQKQQEEFSKKQIQSELETSRMSAQAVAVQAAQKRNVIKEYEKQFFDWTNGAEGGQLTFLDKNEYDLNTEYEQAVHEEIEQAKKIAEEQAKNNPIDIPLEGQISFTNNNDINQIQEVVEFYSDEAIQQMEKQFASLRRSDKYINSDLNIEKFLQSYGDLSYGSQSTKSASELVDVADKINTIKAELSKSFDSDGKMIGDPQRVKELLKEYDNLTIRVKELKALISSPSSNETIALKIAEDARKAREEADKAKNSFDKLKESINKKISKDYGNTERNANNIIRNYGIRDGENLVPSGSLGGKFDEAAITQQLSVEKLNDTLDQFIKKRNELKQLKDDPLISEEQLKQASQEVDNLKNKVEQLGKDIKANGDKMASAGSINKLSSQIEQFMISNPRITSEARSQLQAYMDTLNSGASISVRSLANMQKGFSDVFNTQMRAGNLGRNIWEQMLGKIREGAAFLLTKFSFYEVFNQFKQGIEIVHQFDDALTEMMKVSDETRTSLEAYQKTTFNTAEAIGANALQIQNSTADFMRLGEALTEAAESAKTANILMNVSEFESIDEATQSLIAMSAAYDDLSKMDIIDKLNEVGNNYSISTSGAAEALQASASALKTAGNDMDEALALVTAGNQIVQDVSKAGNGLRTIALRLTGKQMCPNIE